MARALKNLGKPRSNTRHSFLSPCKRTIWESRPLSHRTHAQKQTDRRRPETERTGKPKIRDLRSESPTPPFPTPPKVPASAPVIKSPQAGPVVRVKAPPQAAAQFRKKLGSGPRLLAARIGKHEGFIRIVLNLTNKPEFTSGFDRDGKVVIQLSNASAEPGSRRVATRYLPVVRLVTASLAEGGTSITVETRRPVSVKSFDLEPDRIGGHRIIVDLRPVAPRTK